MVKTIILAADILGLLLADPIIGTSLVVITIE